MLLRYFSDLHLEKDVARWKRPSIADVWVPKPLPTDQDTVLILPGDIWNGTRPLSFAGESWIARLAQRFLAVVVVFGNHDYWTDNVTLLPGKWRRWLAAEGLDNVHVLELSESVELGSVVIAGVRILGGTLWTDMGRGNPRVMTKFDLEVGADGREMWNDRNYIRATEGYQRFDSSHWLGLHRRMAHHLRLALQKGSEPVLLVTHHAPSHLSARPWDVGLDGYLYTSDLSDVLLDHPRIKMVLHGHTHMKHDYWLGDTRILCNPRGYAPAHLVDDFDEDALIEF